MTSFFKLKFNLEEDPAAAQQVGGDPRPVFTEARGDRPRGEGQSVCQGYPRVRGLSRCTHAVFSSGKSHVRTTKVGALGGNL